MYNFSLVFIHTIKLKKNILFSNFIPISYFIRELAVRDLIIRLTNYYSQCTIHCIVYRFTIYFNEGIIN